MYKLKEEHAEEKTLHEAQLTNELQNQQERMNAELEQAQEAMRTKEKELEDGLQEMKVRNEDVTSLLPLLFTRRRKTMGMRFSE